MTDVSPGGVIPEFREIRSSRRPRDTTVVRLLAAPIVAAVATVLLLIGLRATHAAGAIQVILVGVFVLVAGVASIVVAAALDRRPSGGPAVRPLRQDHGGAAKLGVGRETGSHAQTSAIDLYDLPSGSWEHCLVCGGPAHNTAQAPGRWTCLLCDSRFAADPTRAWPPVVIAPERMARRVSP